jgi:hypothetical protein
MQKIKLSSYNCQLLYTACIIKVKLTEMMKTQRRVQNPSLHVAGFTHNPPSEEALQRITNSKHNSGQIVNMLLFTELNTNH